MKGRSNARTLSWLLLGLLPFLPACRPSTVPSGDGPVTINYWEKWTGFEGEAVQAVADAFNRRQDKVFVKVLTVSEIEKKLLVSIAGGDPPDLSGLYSRNVPVYAALGALAPLDDMMKETGTDPDSLIPVYLLECRSRGRYYALPIAGMTMGLHYNRQHFREAGLDPDRPPRTIQELDEYAAKLTKRRKDGTFERIGFIPTEPGWWNWSWVYYLGGSLYDERNKTIIADTPENERALRWFADYARKYGIQNVLSFKGGFGNFASPQNAFLAGKQSMCIQGVWMHSFIQKFNPKLDWGVAPFPAFSDEVHDRTLIESDVLVIPAGSRHPKEAMQFLAFAVSQEGQEILHLRMMKFPMTKKASKDFWAKNTNPHLAVYRRLADSPCAYTAPRIAIFQEYFDEANAAFDQVWLLRQEPKVALSGMQKRMQRKWERELNRLKRMGLQPE
jgi:ABC-type glycerol-3-phosphate transport system substrate-binding protein